MRVTEALAERSRNLRLTRTPTDKRISLQFCDVFFTAWGAETIFPDGSRIGAYPHPEMPHYSVIAHRLGYQDDLLRYAQEHEFSHAYVEERLNQRPSQVLSALARGKPLAGPDAAYEEITAQVFQAFLRGNIRPIVSGVPWDRLKADALELLGG